MLKKWLLLMILVLMISLPSYADDTIRIELDGKPLVFEIAPVAESGRVLVPFSTIFESLGLKVDWNSNLRIATAYNDMMNVSIQLDAMYGNINGEIIKLDVGTKVRNNRLLVPVKFVSEALKHKVTWNGDKRLISITSGFKTYDYTEPLPTVDSLEKLKLIMDYSGNYTRRDGAIVNTPSVDGSIVLEDAAPTLSPEAAPDGKGEETDFSGTNVQVEGVDEADIVKTDGKYLYHLRLGDLKITELTGAMKTISTITFEGDKSPSEFYLYDDQLVVIANQQFFYPYPMPVPMPLESQNDLIEADRMPMIMPMQTPKTHVLIYDIVDKSSPLLIRDYESEGYYVTSRVTGGKLYMVMNKNLGFYGLTEEGVLPNFNDIQMSVNPVSGKVVETSKVSQIGFEDIRYFPDTIESNLMITLGFDLKNPTAEPHQGAYLGSSSNVYANTQSMVVAMDRYHYDYTVKGEFAYPVFYNTTELYKFDLENGNINFSAKGSVPGRVLNQFSMDAYDGNYRIATTTGETWDNTSTNNLYVLDENMLLIGKLEGLAPTERIFSARFVGDRAYLVTFRQVDPFYVIDMADPSSPKVLGYLKIPGFSDYLHPYDANTIIGFGRETIETANGQVVGGIKIAMFDVTDVANPVEKSQVVIGSAGTYSEVLYNAKALLFSKTKNLFALPVTVYEGLGSESHFAFQGAYVYSVDTVNGFVLRGTSTHLTQAEIDDSDIKWYDTTKDVSRIVYSGDTLYTLSQFGIKSHNLTNMTELNYLAY